MCKINQISIVHKKVIIATLCVFAQFLVRFCAEIETREPNFSELTYFIQIHIYKYAFVTIANMYLSYLQICFCHICKHVFVIFGNMFAQE